MNPSVGDGVPDLRPTPWRAHVVIVGVLAVLFVIFAIAVMPPAGTDQLKRSLTVLVIVVYGLGVAGFALVATALLAATRSLLIAYAGSAAITALVIGALVLAP